MDPLRNIPRLSDLSGHLQSLPTTDRGIFSTLATISDIQAWTAAKADEYRKFALALLAIHNLAAPIHRLPTEVLERVFADCWQDWDSLRLPHVCRLWRSILLDRPEFWADAVANSQLQEKREFVRSELPLIDALLSRSTQHSHTIEPTFFLFPPAIAQSVTPYSSSIASLCVAVSRLDVRDGLWPVLLSGMPNLETLTIQPAVTEEEWNLFRGSGYVDLMRSDLSPAWGKLPMLSSDALPKLSRLTCPHSMVGRFSDVPLTHLRVEVMIIKPPHLDIQFNLPTIVLGRPQGLHLEPLCGRLEVLEIMPTGIAREDPYATPLEPLELFSLRHLQLEGCDHVVPRILSWVQLPQAACINITRFFSTPSNIDLGMKLHPILDTVDRACLTQLKESSYSVMDQYQDYRTQCFAGGMERLRIDSLRADSRIIISIFGENAPITHLELCVTDPCVLMKSVSLRAFPHLVQLDVSGSDLHYTGVLLEPTLHPWQEHGYVWGLDDPHGPYLPSCNLAELVISCPPPSSREIMCLDTGPDSDFGTKVDKSFTEDCGVLQQALTDRAAAGTRLTHLTISLRPATLAADSDGTCAATTDAMQQDQVRPQEEAGGGGEHGGNEPGSGSSEKVGNTESALNSRAFWPSHAARRATLQSLRELVDGPVVLKLLDDAGDEVSVEEA